MGTIVSGSKSFIFIHIPKTAGRSVDSILGPYRDDVLVNHKIIRSSRDIIKSYTNIAIEKTMFKGLIPEHATLEDVCSYKGSDIIDKYYKFCIVRSPWERALSEYIYQKYSARSRYLRYSYWANYNETFDEWLERAADEVRYGKHNTQRSMMSLNGSIRVDRVIPIEEIDVELPKVLDMLNIGFDGIKKLNAKTKERAVFYNKDRIRNVEDLYREDLEAFSSMGIDYKPPKGA